MKAATMQHWPKAPGAGREMAIAPRGPAAAFTALAQRHNHSAASMTRERKEHR